MTLQPLIYRVREPLKDGGRQFVSLECAASAAKEWFDDTGVKCFIECKSNDSDWVPSVFVAEYIQPVPVLFNAFDLGKHLS